MSQLDSGNNDWFTDFMSGVKDIGITYLEWDTAQTQADNQNSTLNDPSFSQQPNNNTTGGTSNPALDQTIDSINRGVSDFFGNMGMGTQLLLISGAVIGLVYVAKKVI